MEIQFPNLEYIQDIRILPHFIFTAEAYEDKTTPCVLKQLKKYQNLKKT
jgi:hypothetical protein